MKKIDVVKYILRSAKHGQVVTNEGSAWAPSNVALCKYWGKRDAELNLPLTASLSVTLGNKGAFTKIHHREQTDAYTLNGVALPLETPFAVRLSNFLDLFRPQGVHYAVAIDTNVPIAAGFASSACGFASLVQALNQLYAWQLSKLNLSILARLGSGSACRSLFPGFVEWQQGDSDDGMDSYGVPLEYTWPELRIGILTLSLQEKAISSRAAMQHTIKSSPLYRTWPDQVAHDLIKLKIALARKDFILLGEIAEHNAISMHTIMGGASPPIIYSLPATFSAIDKIHAIRRAGTPLFFTQDAGPNLQLLFLEEQAKEVAQAFPELEVVVPFTATRAPQIILVDNNDVALGTSEKLAAHMQGKLHRAFSVMVLRKKADTIEVLLQQRSSYKYHSANLWSNTCCGHPAPNQDILTAATDRLYEEMGFRVALKEVGSFHYQATFSDVDLMENEIDHVLVGFTDLEEFSFNVAEVQNYQWREITDLACEVRHQPHNYTAWLPYVINLILKKLNASQELHF